ncbi:MAG TPA: ABC transporter ATP-binding protein, partial [Chloroflexota bacterium]|nr:ABC transporter ATP-binding protein [Chloroflexota bacterium]
VRRRLSYVFQYPEHQFVGGTVRDEVLFGLGVRHQEPRAAQRRTQDVLERFGLAPLAEASPYTLSHGQKRRLSVATALVTEPEMLILDEPTFGQDRRHTDELMSTLRGLHREGRTIVVITHDLSLVAEHACRVAALDAGEVLFDGSPHHLFARPEILNRCHLRRPPVAEAFSLARDAGSACPAAISLTEAASVLGPIHDGRPGGI